MHSPFSHLSTTDGFDLLKVPRLFVFPIVAHFRTPSPWRAASVIVEGILYRFPGDLAVLAAQSPPPLLIHIDFFSQWGIPFLTQIVFFFFLADQHMFFFLLFCNQFFIFSSSGLEYILR